ncbi:S1 family peptidase [Ornithinibacillus xuwenensis]|uniref:Serine protease n=1 Tax=Ornithinibacillus xuwenensis TaxID=3144668 RepID=A0ABU9XJT9_9BACI
MDKEKKVKPDIIDDDLYEEFEDDELYEIVEQVRQDALRKAAMKEENKQPKRPFPKWAFWLIAIALLLNVIAILPRTFSIPAIDFLITSAKLSTDEEIQQYKKSVVVVETEESKGTGFSISSDGYILTNHHVVDDVSEVKVGFPNNGIFTAEVVERYPDVDLALLKTESDDKLPYLTLIDKTVFEKDEPISFIGNPLAFNGIANQGTIIGYTELKSWEKPVVMIRAPVYRGNSGSPIINQDGKVIGIIFATIDHDEHGKVGLFIPVDYFYEQQNNL